MRQIVARCLLLVALAAGSFGFHRAATAAQEPPARPGHLVVADNAAQTLYVYALADFSLVAEIPQVVINDHAGFLPLPDGRLLFVDAERNELVALQVDGGDGPAVVGRAPVPAEVSHIAVDPAGALAAVGSADELRPLTLIDLGSYTTRSLDVEAGEVGLMLGGDPLSLFHRNDALMQVEAYPLDRLVVGGSTPTGVVPTGAFGHGEAIGHANDRLYMATDDGIDVVQSEGGRLTYRTTLPWEASGRTGGRAYFVRLTGGGQHLVSYIADRGGEETPWETWTNDLYIADLESEEATRVELGPGLVYRFALSETYALFFNMHPDGDFAHLVDVAPSSPTFATVLAKIALDPLAKAPKAGESPWESESRIAAIAPDGSVGFVSHGGDGIISVIDTEVRAVSDTIEVPSALSGGGYMIAVQPGMPFVDTVAR